MGMRPFLAFFGTSAWVIEAPSLGDARTEALRLAGDELERLHLMPLAPDEIRVRPATWEEVAAFV